ncbi:MAG TPA: FAD-dependent oxidoreductase [Kiritimatiellia bacterium]|jgi:2-polyprenyl-6-methoxyphenol hydroxylase-like FAD-dependent oxidoreductase|nr:FAD-dependent oxidoreductase [Kiritimatiellia bacterium]
MDKRTRFGIVVGLIVGSLAQAIELPPVTCDVAVVGGGSAGICAALQSARAGAKTVLVEAAHQVGGNTTTGGVNFPGLFHAWGRQVIAGAGWDVVTNAVALDGGKLPDFTKPTGRRHYEHQISINIPLFVVLAEDALVRAGVTLHYHAAPVRIEAVPEGWRVRTAATGDTRTITCKQLVDCTGNGTAAALAGFERLQEQERQPGTFVYHIRPNADLSKFDAKELQAHFDAAVKDGQLHRSDCRWGLLQYLKSGGNTANYVEGADNSTADARTQTNLRGRAAALRMFRFLKGIPGLEKVRLESMSPEVGVRETYRVRGEHLITHEDYTSGKRWEDSVCYAFYPIDLHDKTSGVRPAHLEEGVVATVPLRALIPKGSRNLLVAGRCISSDRLANSALRVQATCMATGQAAGAAAALAAQRGVTPGQLPIAEVKALLTAHGAIVPD